MSKNRLLGMSVVFLAISVFVSGSLVMAVHSSYAAAPKLAVTAARLL